MSKSLHSWCNPPDHVVVGGTRPRAHGPWDRLHAMTGDGAGGRFGHWARAGGLPTFELGTDAEGASPDPRVTPAGGVDACWHGIGNAGITATAHAGGWTTLYATARGMVRLTGPASTWGLAGRPTSASRATRPTPPDRSPRRVTFGLGFAEWEQRDGGALVRRRISAPQADAPVLLVEVTIEGARAGETYEERWVSEPRALLVGALMSTFEPPPPGYTRTERLAWSGLYGLSAVVRAATNAARLAIAPTLTRPAEIDGIRRAVVFPARHPRRDHPMDGAATPAWFDRSLPDLFCTFLDQDGGEPTRPLHLDEHAIGVELTGPESTTLRFAVGLADDREHLDALRAFARDQARTFTPSAWASLAELTLPASPDVEREAPWHATALVAAEQHDDYFGRRYIAQGSAYGFIHGLQGAPRDYALYTVPMAYIDPAAAREQLEVMMRMTRPSGTTYYAHTGRGRCTSGGLHAAPTDLPLFLLWSLTDYVWTTGDVAFLDEPVPFYPADRGETATPAERAALAIDYVIERVGCGPHGLLRVGSGDWSDPISAMVADRKAFHELGESGFNTAFAVYALPRAAALIEDRDPGAARRARDLAAELRRAMEATWSGSWFLRGWDGRGAPIGDEHLFLDGQVWALIAGIGTDEQRDTLVQAIAERCDDPSPIGATILDRPHDVRLGMLAPGWDCNGGVWATINALLAWGYACHDPDRAWRNLQKQSLAAHARAYPAIWYGIWSGPDAYNAHFGSRAGETFVQPATPMREFPVMNANAHAGPLLGLVRTLGIECEAEGIVVRDRAAVAGAWRLETALGTFGPAGFDPHPPPNRS